MNGEPQTAVASHTEAQARRALKSYPARWRREHGEALIGTLLDVAEADGRDRLTRAEVADTLAQGLLQRLRTLTGAEVVRLLAIWAMIIGGALAVSALVLGEILPPYRPGDPVLRAELVQQRVGWLPLHTTGPALYLLWVALLIAALRGRVSLVRRLAAVAALTAVCLPVVHHFFGWNRPPFGVLISLAILAALIAIGPWRRDELARTATTTLILAAVAIALGLIRVLSTDPEDTDGYQFYTAFGFAPIYQNHLLGHNFGEIGGRIYVLLAPVGIGLAVLSAAVQQRIRALTRSRDGS